MTALTLPDCYSQILRTSAQEGPVLTTVHSITDLLSDEARSPRFFPEYTAHGIGHIQRVLDSTAALVPPPFLPKLTPEDIAVITGAVILHDLALHLTQEGFLTLILSNTDRDIGPGPHPRWNSLWHDYLAEVGRWTDHKFVDACGEVPSISSHVLCERLRHPDGLLDELCCRVIGEFIRRHHGRLAYDFGVNGFPGASGQRLRIVDLRDSTLDSLAGLVGRSHTVPLRATFPTLHATFHGLASCAHSHPVYLMVLLRIGDYLELDSRRAPPISLNVRTLRSPVSRREWAMHHAIAEVRIDEHDDCALFVLSRPSDIRTFARCRELLSDIQLELDTSWAVLGEVFGRHPQLNNAAITLRRIRSNLDDLAEFRKSITYIPRACSFSINRSSLLSKLVGPLYGDHPEVGIRELIQNSIDAVLELAHMEEARPGTLEEPLISVRLERLEDGSCWVTVADAGIGMTEDTIVEYFLSVGSTLRDSEAWHKNYTINEQPAITRVGRFGIGVLAAYLLGDRIEVCTRHCSAGQDEALSFTVRVHDDLVELRRASRPSQGTTIRIQVSDPTFAQLCSHDGLEWDWYRYRRPVIDRQIDGTLLPRLTTIPSPCEDLPVDWHRLQGTTFDDVLWTFGKAPRVIVNGFTIGESASSHGYRRHFNWEGESKSYAFGVPVRVPSVAVTDKRGIFPIDLPRFSISGHRFPFATELLTEVVRDYCAYSIVCAPSQALWDSPTAMPRDMLHYPGLAEMLPAFTPTVNWLFARDGAIPLHLANLRAVRLRRVRLMLGNGPTNAFPRFSPAHDEGLLLGAISEVLVRTALCQIVGRAPRNLGPNPQFFNTNSAVRLYVPTQMDELVGYDDGQHDLSGIQVSPAGGISVWTVGTPPDDHIDVDEDTAIAILQRRLIVCDLFEPRVTLEASGTIGRVVEDVWLSHMPSPLVPYSQVERQVAFRSVEESLHSYLEAWRSIVRLGQAEFRRMFVRDSPYNERL